MSQLEIYQRFLPMLERFFHELAGHVPPPIKRPFASGFVFRSRDETLEEAAIQKLARIVSGLHAGTVLLEHGFVQELGALERMLDEWSEDVSFLTQPIIGQKRTELHERFLRDFFQEEFDDTTSAIASTQRRNRVPRSKIQAAIARAPENPKDPSSTQELYRTIANANSGFVHGSSPAILDMYGGSPPHFYVSGMLSTPTAEAHSVNFWSYMFRGIISLGFTAFALGQYDLADRIMLVRGEFERASEPSA